MTTRLRSSIEPMRPGSISRAKRSPPLIVSPSSPRPGGAGRGADSRRPPLAGPGPAGSSPADHSPPQALYSRAVTLPNVLVIMTDEERYPPPYESAELQEFRRTQMPARDRIRNEGVELHRHYAGSTACVPSRATLFTGQYPSLHGVSQTSGVAKHSNDPGMRWLDPDMVPTLGDWFRAAGYQSHYRGKWHVSHADLETPGTDEGLMASDDDGAPIWKAIEAYRAADRLNGYGFAGWIGREPHGAAKSDSGTVRDNVFAEQVIDLFGELSQQARTAPWLAVASFVNPHDIAFAGGLYELLLGSEPTDGTVPAIAEAPSQGDSFAGRPACQERFKRLWPQLIAAATRRRGLPAALLLPAQAGGPRDRQDPRRSRRVGDG